MIDVAELVDAADLGSGCYLAKRLINKEEKASSLCMCKKVCKFGKKARDSVACGWCLREAHGRHGLISRIFTPNQERV